ncbi:hypothetical protein Pla8534_59230 [Lignipirellula cremea]|uniref:Uncharacterized protein n=2 Tax=Lignipirellula cremea TaxID=2528010 RepID=A0A518E1W3_9BACT|nr:hypothetical protein Pla8534_59230 [Lignipirellula cremea]
MLPPGAAPPKTPASAPKSGNPARDMSPPGASAGSPAPTSPKIPVGSGPSKPSSPAKSSSPRAKSAADDLLPPGAEADDLLPPGADDNIDDLLPPGADASAPGERVAVTEKPQVLADGTVIITTNDGDQISLKEPVRKVVSAGGEERELHTLTPEEKARRRLIRNVVVFSFCVIVLMLAVYLLV